ncbi:uncharacterized protein LOC107044957 [Diachasma alloeum]|uniref:uncharacterized protein LOC107044957 n=1 Tax=Diachasma alloeum TaxID=454923 RepID=UPI0007381F79|nr:uncharacterized protein LOC107044957 [Diachasma alloeum]
MTANACSIYEEEHFIDKCPKFKQLSPEKRKEFVEKKYLCFNCLGKHSIRACRTTKTCVVCHKRHHSMIYITRRQNCPLETSQPDQLKSQDSLAVKLGLLKSPALLPVVGIGGSRLFSKEFSQFCLKSLHSGKHLQIKAYILDHLTSSLPSFSVSDTQAWGHLEGLKLAHPESMEPRPIDLLIGADFFGSMVKPHIIKGPSDSPIAMNAIFGWVVLGPTSAAIPMVTTSNHIAVSNEELYDLLTSFWLQEEAPKAEDIDLTKEEAECEQFFQRTHSRDSSGRYVVRLPLARSPTELGDSYGRAKACLSSLFRRMERDQWTLQLYSIFLKEYEDLGHMVRVPALTGSGNAGSLKFGCRSEGMTLAHGASASGGLRVPEEKQSARVSTRCSAQRQAHSSTPMYYFPHHGVLRESRETTKLRVVFNGSSKTSSGVSLNDIQHTGAKLQKNISDVLLSSRRSKYIFMTDIRKMFRQIKVYREDWHLQQILWRDSPGQINTYQLTTVIYGTKSALFLACRVLNQLVADEEHRFPLAISPLTSGRYVDDIFGGAGEESGLLEVSKQVRCLCLAGGFPLTKWHCNSPSLLRSLNPEGVSQDHKLLEDAITKILSLKWDPNTDQFKFSIHLPANSKVTKRNMLSEIPQLFDPLGLISPVVIREKALLQRLWIEKLDWDDALSPHISDKWTQFRKELSQVENISIPHWLGVRKDAVVEIHGFSDASQTAMAAVVYVKVISSDGLSVSLATAKTKVAPLKQLTIPRLELNAAVMVEYVLSN